MNFIIQINGREAIPVRAIPLLTDWQTMTPDALAQALAGDEHYFRFENMRAYRFEDGQALPARYWANSVVRPLMALSDTIKAFEISHETGLQEFHTESLKKLPAGVYVWRDEFAQAHQRHYSKITLPLDCGGNDLHLTDGEVAKLTAEHQERITLDFSPFIDSAMHTLVMQGFDVLPTEIEPEQTAPVANVRVVVRVDDLRNCVSDRGFLVQVADSEAPEQTAATPAPVVAASDGPARPAAMVDRGWVMKRAALIQKHERRWSTINRDFQDASDNGLSKAAKAPGHGDWFEVDALNWARQRGKLSEAIGQQTPSPATPFGGLTHRIIR